MPYTFNLGLLTSKHFGDPCLMDATTVRQRAVKLAQEYAVSFGAWRLDESAEEPTLVFVVYGEPSEVLWYADALAKACLQDCVAVGSVGWRNPGRHDAERIILGGSLVGPRSDEWGEFDPQYFKHL